MWDSPCPASALVGEVEAVLAGKLVEDRVGGDAILLVAGTDNASVRGFLRKLPGGQVADFYRTPEGVMIDSIGGERWDFRGCAAKDRCLQPIQITKDYWFDWRNYNPQTTVFNPPGPRELAPPKR